jgi:hypothetical protein
MNIKDLVKDKIVQFVSFQRGEFTYKVAANDGHDFFFTVPLWDIGDGKLLNEDKAILYMRWIKKQLELNEKEITS